MKRTIALFALFFSTGVFSYGMDISSWKAENIFGGQIWALAMQPSNHNVLLAGGINTLYKSTDNGATWTSKGIADLITDITFAPSKPDIVYVMGGLTGLYKSADAGETWNNSSTPTRFDKIACDPSNENILYACATQSNPNVVYKSLDAGASWKLIYTLDAGFSVTRLVAVSPTNIIITTNNNETDGAIYRSTDAGATWACLKNELDPNPACRNIHSFAVDPSSPNVQYAGGAHYIFKSTDNGVTWSEIDVSGSIGLSAERTVMIVVKNANDLLACNRTTMFNSNDGGNHWSLVGKMDASASGPFGSLSNPVYDSTNGILYIAD